MLAICNGMPRSGSTLLYNVARTLIAVASDGEAHGFVTSDKAHGCYCSPETLDAWAASPVWHVVKTHEVLDRSGDLLDRGARILYIYRDVRDVAVSMKRAFSHRGEKLMSAIERALGYYAALDELRGHREAKVHWCRYEEVYADLPAAIEACDAFLGLNASPGQLAAVHEQCRVESAETMTANARGHLARMLQEASPERADEIRDQVRDRGWLVGDFLLHHHHISPQRGAPGSWEGSLTADEIHAIPDRFADLLAARGYTTQPA